MERKPSYGGQAVIEGVMMQGPGGKAIAVRQQNGEIVYKVGKRKMLKEKYPILGLPIIRGVVSFFESLLVGMQDLTWASAQYGDAEYDKLSPREIFITVLIAFMIALALFVGLPVFVGTVAYPYVGDFGRSLIEGLLRIAVFVIYVLIVSKVPEIKRLFAYHGAEHKTIACYEAGEVLTVEAARKYSTLHPRCGTSFIFMVFLLTILVFTFIGQGNAWYRILVKILCFPLVAGLSYELFRLPVYFPKNRLVHALVAPGLCMQRLTTNEPDDDQLEVAIAAITAVPGFPAEQIAIVEKPETVEGDAPQSEAAAESVENL